MATVGRNDPCPCGSGRKYKACCMPKDRAAQARGVGRRAGEHVLWDKLLAYGQRPALFADVPAAVSRFWYGDYGIETLQALGRTEMLTFLEWYLYDYRTSHDRQRIADLFAAEEATHLSLELRELLAEHQTAYLSLYAVEAVLPEGVLQLGDLLAGGYYEMAEPGLARLVNVGDLLLGRRYGEGPEAHMSMGTAVLPVPLLRGLLDAAKAAYSAYREENYGATMPEFLREAGYLVFHYLLSQEAAEAYERAPQREGYYDPRAAVAKMHEFAAQAQEQRRKQSEAEAQQKQAQQQPGLQTLEPPVGRTSGGILIPGQPKPPTEGGGLIIPGRK
jgi:hypothetical protein